MKQKEPLAMINSSHRLALGAASTVLVLGLVAGCTNYDPRTVDEEQPPPPITLAVSAAPAATTAASTTPGGAVHVVLSVATPDAVTIDVTDASTTLVGATTGTPGDGATVDAYKLSVANVTETRLRLTWVGGPCDSANTLSIDAARHQFLLVQPECGGDAIATDRILELIFSSPIRATDVQGFLQDGLDTSS
jgi:hypothetical protein